MMMMLVPNINYAIIICFHFHLELFLLSLCPFCRKEMKGRKKRACNSERKVINEEAEKWNERRR